VPHLLPDPLQRGVGVDSAARFPLTEGPTLDLSDIGGNAPHPRAHLVLVERPAPAFCELDMEKLLYLAPMATVPSQDGPDHPLKVPDPGLDGQQRPLDR